ncbi:hypothetical protein F52700_927 [Fusarium sp. NRRL 52700]|nr:hypothetical protein F52700_927 [Fusarium sp. NRRL 52700]
MCFLIVTTYVCDRCGKAFRSTQSHRKCASQRGTGRPYHAHLDIENVTKYKHWVDCKDCEYEYSMYAHAQAEGIAWPTPNPPFH